MVNTTQFYKTKIALAVVLSLGLAACSDSEGDQGSTSTSTTAGSTTDATQNTVGNQNELTGTVQGVVVDSNGTPIAGAMVYLGAQETTTNAGGQYVFTDVAVTNVNGTNNEGNETPDSVVQTLIVTIGGTDAYLGALVEVTPEAMVNNTGGQGDNQDGGNSDTTIQTFVDGFTAQAGTAILPMLNAGAYGYIRDCRTGVQLVDTADLLSLDFDSVSADVDVDPTGNDTQITNAEHTVTIGSDSTGGFSLMNLAANSSYTITPKEGWTIMSGTTSFDTNSEGSSEFLDTIEVCPVGFTGRDLTPDAPYIASVAGSIDSITGGGTTNYEYEVLGKGIDGTGEGITLNFSEAISAADVDVSDIVVTLAANTDDTVQTEAEVASATLADDGMSMTVVLAEALGDEQRFSIWFPRYQYVDNTSKTIVTGDDYSVGGALTAPDTVEDNLVIDALAGDGAGSTEFGIASDVVSEELGKVGYIRARICTYIAPPTTPEGLTAEQEVKTLDSSLLAVSPLWDNSAAGSVTNLNGQEDAVAGKDTGERLVERFGGTVTNNTAFIEGSVNNATGITASAGNVAFANPGFGVTVTGAAHGQTVTLTPTGAFGVSGTPLTVTLEDKVAPTTILQENYELWAIEADYNATTLSAGTGAAGSGGEVSEGSVAGEDGDPIIYIQPRHLTQTDSNNRSIANSEFEDLAFATDFTDGATDNSIYSAPGYAAWTTRGNSLGVAFSETIATTATAPDESASVDVVLTGVLNGLTTDIDGNLIVGTVDSAGNTVIPKSGEDLARFTVSDMIDFANNDHNEAIDFTNGSIADTRGNLANANSAARVVIRDAMPAFVTAAFWDGTNVEITFNEPVVPDGTGGDADVFIFTDLVAGGPGFDLTLDATADFPDEGAYSLDVAGTTLTIAVDSANVQGLFQDGPDDIYDFDSNGDGDTENHVALTFDTIADANGNSWSTFDIDLSAAALGNTVDSDNDTVADRQGRYLVNAPRFMLYNDVGPFEVTNARFIFEDDDGVAVFTDTDGSVTFTITFSHPLDLQDLTTDMGGAMDGAGWNGTQRSFNGSIVADKAVIDAMFEIDLDGTGANPATALAASGSAANDLTVTISSDYRTITIVTSEAIDAITANVTRISFLELLDSSIIDGAQWATLDYIVTNTQ